MVNVYEYIEFGESVLDTDIKQKIVSVLNEIVAFPEGEKLLKEAASKVGDNKIIIDYYEGVPTLSTDKGIILGTINPTDKYLGIDGQYYDVTLHRVLFYQLLHLGLYISMKEKIRKIENGELTYRGFVIEEYEPEAIYTTNQFMTKYFSEVPRTDFNHSEVNEFLSPWTHHNEQEFVSA